MFKTALKGAVFAITATAMTAPAALADAFTPKQPVEMVIMAGTGGGADRLARLIQSIIQKNRMAQMPFIPVNKGGGSGAEALRYVKDKAGNEHIVMATLNSYFTTPLRTDIGVDIENFTPLARLAVDTFVLWVNADSEIETLEDYIAAVKAKGDSWKMGGTGTGQEDELITGMLENEFEMDINYIPYKGGGAVAKALVGGHIDSSVNNPSEALGFYEAGKLRPIATFTPTRLDALSDTPTMTELGHEMVYFMQRSFVAPADISDEARAYYTNLFQQVNDSAEWQDYTAKKSLFRDFITGDELQAYFMAEREAHRALLAEEKPTN